MAVDEFGREIPAPSGSNDDHPLTAIPRHVPSPRRRTHSQEQRHYHHNDRSSRSHRDHSSRDHSSRDRDHNDRRRSPRTRPPHPSFQYVEEPLLCEYVWKDQNPDKQEEKDKLQEEEKEQETTSKEENDNEDETTETEHVKEETTTDAADTTTTTTPYTKYRQTYCLQYIRSFFNHHLDDTWFRQEYSPHSRHQVYELERARRRTEAECLLDQAARQKVDFCVQARLGGGIKSSSSSTQLQPAPKSHLFSWQQPASSDNDDATTNNKALETLVVSEIPPSVTDEQLWLALWNATASTDKTNGAQAKPPLVYSTSHQTLSTAGRNVLQRKVLLVGQHLYKRFEALQQQQTSTSSTTTSASVSLEVDCTDPYGRLEYDANGRGGAPADGLAVPLKKATVQIQRLVPADEQLTSSKPQQPTVVLSAAVSARPYDKDTESALQLARQMDDMAEIPEDYNCQALWKVLGLTAPTESSSRAVAKDKEKVTNDNNDETTKDDPSSAILPTDALDVTIAYLRRVHLTSFYNGCDQPAQAVADVLTMTQLPASTVHLRLQTSTNDTTAADPDDLLVRRLDTSLQTALDKTSTTALETSQEELATLRSQAQEITDAQDKVQDTWLQDHSILDQDDRARCSFHFCHKLFKDNAFLHKHLLKKHGAYLQAEQAKCHDPYMMKRWDAAEDRPVPDVLVDCGSRFGYVAAKLQGGPVPDCQDPEPALWQRQEDERQERQGLQKARREQVRQMQQQHQQQRDAAPPPRNFVDVDDMKEEKVELSFDNVQVTSKKKKKKKRKLL